MNPTLHPTPDLPREHGIIDDHLERLRAFYEEAGAPPVNRAAQGYRRMLARCYALMFPPDASVLEVGCGGGDLLALLPNRDVTGVDLSPVQIETAQRRLPHGRFHVQAGEHLTLDRAFDVIILSETIKFAADVQRVIENVVMYRTTRTDPTPILTNLPWTR